MNTIYMHNDTLDITHLVIIYCINKVRRQVRTNSSQLFHKYFSLRMLYII